MMFKFFSNFDLDKVQHVDYFSRRITLTVLVIWPGHYFL